MSHEHGRFAELEHAQMDAVEGRESEYIYRSSPASEVYMLWRDGELPLGAFPGSVDSDAPKNTVINMWMQHPMNFRRRFMLRVKKDALQPYTCRETGVDVHDGEMRWTVGNPMDGYTDRTEREFYNTRRIPREEIDVAIIDWDASLVRQQALVCRQFSLFEKIARSSRRICINFRYMRRIPIRNVQEIWNFYKKYEEPIRCYARLNSSFPQIPEDGEISVEKFLELLEFLDDATDSIYDMVGLVLSREFGKETESVDGSFYIANSPREEGDIEIPRDDDEDGGDDYYLKPEFFKKIMDSLQQFYAWVETLPTIDNTDSAFSRNIY